MKLLDFFKKKNNECESLMTRESLIKLRFGTVLDFDQITNISIILKEDEFCFYKDNCTVTELKEETISYESDYNGISIKVAKGVNYKTGKSKSTPVKKSKEIEYKGILYLTNKRIIFVNEQKGFDKKLTDITSIQGIASILKIQIGNKYYSMTTPTAAEFITAYYELNLLDIKKMPKSKPLPNNVFDKDLIYDNAKDDPLYYVVASGLIKTDGHLTLIHRSLYPVSFRRIYTILESLITDNIILNERQENGYHKVNVSYEDWITKRINNKEY